MEKCNAKTAVFAVIGILLGCISVILICFGDMIFRNACKLRVPLTVENLEKLGNCTAINGKIEILAENMGGEVRTSSNGTEYTTGGLKVADLERLSKVLEVSDYVRVEGGPYLRNLLFLRNLQQIAGNTRMDDEYSLVVKDNSEMDSLSLASLRSLGGGKAQISNNSLLCFVHTVAWNRLSRGAPTLRRNRNQTLCEIEGRVCGKECYKDWGCWEKGVDMCLKRRSQCANDRG